MSVASGGRCTSNHLMTVWTDREFDNIYQCSFCHAESKAEEIGLRCHTCNINRCLQCLSELAGHTCRNGHPLAKHAVGTQAACDKCGSRTAPVPTQMVCLSCDYVLCHQCIINDAQNPAPQQGQGNNKNGNVPLRAALVPPAEINMNESSADYSNNRKAASPTTHPSAVATSQSGGDHNIAYEYAINNTGNTNFATTNQFRSGELTFDTSAAATFEGAANQQQQTATGVVCGASIVWYKATAGVGGAFTTDIDSSWLLNRPTRQVYFQDGLLADVTSAYGYRFEIAQTSKAEVGDEIYFTLPEWFPAAERAFAEMPQYAPFPEIYAKDRTFDEKGYGPSTSINGGDSESLTTFDLNYWANQGRSGSLTLVGRGDTKFKVLSIISTVLLTAFAVGALWVNLLICEAIGKTNKWDMVFLWLFLGLLVYCALFALFAFLIPKVFGSCGGGENNPVAKAIFLTILLFVWSCCFGAPMAWTESQLTAGENYLKKEATKTLNCWRNPNERFSMIDQHFVVFEEAEWIVDYKLRYNQGVSTLVGTDDNNVDDGRRFNFCVAPMAYRGLPNCPQQTFFAACFRETSMQYLASCDDNDAKTCGWDFPSPGNILRTMNRNEQFWAGIEEEDESHWRAAAGYASVPGKEFIIGFYSGEGPNEISEYVEKAEDLQLALLIGGLISLAGVSFIFMFFVNWCSD